MKPIDIAPADLVTVQGILSQYVPGLEVRAFGSRVSWNARTTSDLDLALLTTEPLDFALKADLREAFAKSDLPFRVDIVDWAATSEDFQDVIEQEYVVISGSSAKTKGKEINLLTNNNCYAKKAWSLVAIGDIAQIEGGSTPSTHNPNNFGGDVPWITPKDLSTIQTRFVLEGSRNLTHQGLKNCSARLVPRGAVLLSTRAPIGLVAIACQEVATNQGIRSLIPSKDIISEYLYYWLKANTEILMQYAAGTTFLELSGSSLKQIQICLPPLTEQKVITHILGTLDDKIELNHQMNQTLGDMAQTIFKSWFVNFDLIRTKAESLVDSELGKIPKRWKWKKIGDMVQVLGGTTPSTKEQRFWSRGKNAFCTPKDMSLLKNPILLQTKRYLTNEGVSKISSKQLPIGTVLLSSRAPIGYSAISGIPVSVNQGIIAIVCNRSFPNSYVFYWVRENLNIIKSNANGSTFSEMSKKNFRSLAILVPEQWILHEFNRHIRSFHKSIVNNWTESLTLVSMRDNLLSCLTQQF